MRAALIDQTGTVTNLIVVPADYTPPEGIAAVIEPPEDVAIGWTFTAGTWTPPPAPPAPSLEEELQRARAAMIVTPLQARRAMTLTGYRDAFEQWAAAPERTVEERDFIEYAPFWHRSSPMVAAGAIGLGLSDEAIDALFTIAAEL